MQRGERERRKHLSHCQMTFPLPHEYLQDLLQFFHSSLPLDADSTPPQQHFDLQAGMPRTRLRLGDDTFKLVRELHTPSPPPRYAECFNYRDVFSSLQKWKCPWGGAESGKEEWGKKPLWICSPNLGGKKKDPSVYTAK
ncbi:hypothetical protein KIL84_022336 [Mauremys mutica]|uniref:Uncharacterized protein n=1 Tax=Mauremys mutica TaxID=74926 RepID=A0A9D3XA62_9SAUR|nr:hypothetical protein KIL84_022336 [Mauremys mutica]